MCIVKRLNHLIEVSNMTIKAFSDQTEIPYRSVQSYLRAERELSIDAAIKIANTLGVSLNWLILGQGEMFINLMGESTINADELSLLEKYRATTQSGKRIIQSTCNVILDELQP